jgi:hypothetical protein
MVPLDDKKPRQLAVTTKRKLTCRDNSSIEIACLRRGVDAEMGDGEMRQRTGDTFDGLFVKVEIDDTAAGLMSVESFLSSQVGNGGVMLILWRQLR